VRTYLDVLTNWYIRRSRDRFWEGDPDAIDTLHTVLSTFTRLIAPLLPLIADEIHVGLREENDPTSVHLADWPTVDELPGDDDLVASMDLARDVCSATLSVRKAHQRRVRLPLRTLTVAAPDVGRLSGFTDLIADEVNVRDVVLTDDVGSVASEVLKLVPAKLGPRLGKDVQRVIRAHKAGEWSHDGDTVVVGGVELEPGEYTVEQVAADDQASTGLSTHTGVVALDIDVTEELEVEGRARDLIRLVQQARRDADLHVSDRVRLSVAAPAPWIDALRTHETLVTEETLAISVESTIDDGLSEPVIGVVAVGE
jgi:isoleucyl-tRNA synthetase